LIVSSCQSRVQFDPVVILARLSHLYGVVTYRLAMNEEEKEKIRGIVGKVRGVESEPTQEKVLFRVGVVFVSSVREQ
jgi:hypothetical protein